ncbi:MAG: hypothetical protein ABIG39_04310 [Candidatus Micrarchaeota archaeon]
MKSRLRAQAAMEFMTFFGFFALIFLLLSTTLLEKQTAQTEMKRWDLVKEICLNFRDEVDTAVIMGDGYWRVLSLEGTGVEYEIRIMETSITVISGEEERQYATVVASDGFEGPSGDGAVVLHSNKGNVRIENRGGVIVFEQ